MLTLTACRLGRGSELWALWVSRKTGRFLNGTVILTKTSVIRGTRWIQQTFAQMGINKICLVILEAHDESSAAATLFPNNDKPYTMLDTSYTAQVNVSFPIFYLREKVYYDASASVVALLGENPAVGFDTAKSPLTNYGVVTTAGWWHVILFQAVLVDYGSFTQKGFYNMHGQQKLVITNNYLV